MIEGGRGGAHQRSTRGQGQGASWQGEVDSVGNASQDMGAPEPGKVVTGA